MKYFVIYKREDEQEVHDRLLQQFDPKVVSTMEWPEDGDLIYLQEKDQICVAWLPEAELRQILSKAADHDCLVVVLPHPKAKNLCKNLGIEQDEESIIKALPSIAEPVTLELLFCNDEPVFHNLKAGSIFSWEYGIQDQSLIKKLIHFLRRIRSSGELINQPYSVTSGEEKLIETAATGILAVEHPGNSIISKHWGSDEGVADGHFHFFIVAPQNIFDLFRYLFRSLLARPSAAPFKPDFIGYIKAADLTLKGAGPIKYLLDDMPKEADALEFRVHSTALRLLQTSKYAVQEQRQGSKKSIRLKGLPVGDRRAALLGRKVPWLPRATAEDFTGLLTTLRENSALSRPFLMMLVLSTLIASLGLYANSSPVIIGAMILAPLMAPIVSFSMGLIRYDLALMRASARTILVGTLLAMSMATLLSLILPMRVETPEIHTRLSPNLLDLWIAILSGIAAAYAHARESIAQSLAGVAISVALVPPLAVTGIGLGWWNWEIFSGAMLLFLTNLAGIILFAGVSFLLLGFAPFKTAGKGLLYTLLMVMALSVPLSISFARITEEARIINLLEGYTYDEFTIRDVDVRHGQDMMVIIRLVSNQSLNDEDLHQLKAVLSERIGHQVRIQMISVVELE